MRLRLTYADVTATLALVLALSGGAYAVTQLADNSVATRHLKDGAVTRAKIADGSVTTAKVGDGTLKAVDFAPGQLVRWRGEWTGAATYRAQDVVSFDGSSYVATATMTGTVPPNGSWVVLAQKGQNGSPGLTGPMGPSWGDSVYTEGPDVPHL